jgi:hypothetical protein
MDKGLLRLIPSLKVSGRSYLFSISVNLEKRKPSDSSLYMQSTYLRYRDGFNLYSSSTLGIYDTLEMISPTKDPQKRQRGRKSREKKASFETKDGASVLQLKLFGSKY